MSKLYPQQGSVPTEADHVETTLVRELRTTAASAKATTVRPREIMQRRLLQALNGSDGL